MAKITFGTSGWRAVLAEDFTFANVRRATKAVARWVHEHGLTKRGVLLAGDRRFFSERFQEAAGEILAGEGIPVRQCPLGTPTPVVSFAVLQHRAAGSINFTASHNPAEYQGFKFNGPDGGPAAPDVTRDLEQKAAALSEREGEEKRRPRWEAESLGLWSFVDEKAKYFARLKELVDFSVIRKAHLRVIYDALYGNGAGYTDVLLEEAGVDVTMLHAERDPYFGGLRPEPGPHELQEAAKRLGERPAHLVLANDGDADRFGVLDSDGTFLTPNEVLVLLLHHFVQYRPEWKGAVVRTVASTHLLDAICRRHGLEICEVPVGFKYIAQKMAQGPVLLGGEESGGLTVFGHIPEKDGVLACLLLAEVMARAGRPLKTVLAQIQKEYGPVRNRREDIVLDEEKKERLRDKFTSFSDDEWNGRRLQRIQREDGLKLVFENGSWVLFRLSGTEPLARCYMEASSEEELNALSAAAGRFLEE